MHMVAGFYVVSKEVGAMQQRLPIWASEQPNPIPLADLGPDAVVYESLGKVPGAFMLSQVLSRQECHDLIAMAERLGFEQDAPVSLPHSIRHNHSLTWLADDDTLERIWRRIGPFMNRQSALFHGAKCEAINGRWRFYRYREGDYFDFHKDSAWTSSRLINGQMDSDADAALYSQMSWLLALNDEYEGGITRFKLANKAASSEGQYVDVRTPAGWVLCFPHGSHGLQCEHSSTPIGQGTKYIVRSDVLFRRAQ